MKESDYFSARGVSGAMYENAPLPYYFKEIIESLPQGARILDFGCGFGQTLRAIQMQNFAWSDSSRTRSACGDFCGSASNASLRRTTSAPHSLISHFLKSDVSEANESPQNSSTILECQEANNEDSRVPHSQGETIAQSNTAKRSFFRKQGEAFLEISQNTEFAMGGGEIMMPYPAIYHTKTISTCSALILTKTPLGMFKISA